MSESTQTHTTSNNGGEQIPEKYKRIEIDLTDVNRDVTRAHVEELCSKYGRVNDIEMRRDRDRFSYFVTFGSTVDAEFALYRLYDHVFMGGQIKAYPAPLTNDELKKRREEAQERERKRMEGRDNRKKKVVKGPKGKGSLKFLAPPNPPTFGPVSRTGNKQGGQNQEGQNKQGGQNKNQGGGQNQGGQNGGRMNQQGGNNRTGNNRFNLNQGGNTQRKNQGQNQGQNQGGNKGLNQGGQNQSGQKQGGQNQNQGGQNQGSGQKGGGQKRGGRNPGQKGGGRNQEPKYRKINPPQNNTSNNGSTNEQDERVEGLCYEFTIKKIENNQSEELNTIILTREEIDNTFPQHLKEKLLKEGDDN